MKNHARKINRLTAPAVSIIGAGAVGTAMALLLHKAHYPVVSVISRNKKSAQRLARLVRCPHSSSDVADLHHSTRLLFMTVPDFTIHEVADAVAQTAALDFSSLTVFHTSGSLTSDELSALQKKGAEVCSLHPIQTFPRGIENQQMLRRMKGISYGVEGTAGAVRYARRLIKEMKGDAIIVPKEEKILYHISCVFASNYVIALLGLAEQFMKDTSMHLSLQQLQPLITASIDNTLSDGASKAMTGPIARGDEKLIEKHIAVLQAFDRQIVPLYQRLGMQALELVKAEKKISVSSARKMQKLLQDKMIERNK